MVTPNVLVMWIGMKQIMNIIREMEIVLTDLDTMTLLKVFIGLTFRIYRISRL